MNVPEYNQQYKTDRTAQAYINNNVPAQAFRSADASNLARATAYTARALNSIANDMAEKRQKDEKDKILEYVNEYEKFQEPLLYNQDNGYYTTSGKNAVESYDSVWQQLNEKAASIVEGAQDLSQDGLEQLKNVLDTKVLNTYQGLNTHAAKEKKVYQKNLYDESLNLTFQNAVHNRYDKDRINVNLKDIENISLLNAQALGLDDAAFNNSLKTNKENLHVALLNQYVADGRLDIASNYLENNKNAISVDNYTKMSALINKEKDKQKTERNKAEERAIAENIFSTSESEEKALQLVDSIDDVDKRDAVYSRVKTMFADKRRIEEQQETDRLDSFYTEANRRLNSGEALSYDMIDPDIDPKTQLSLKKFIDENADPQTDNQVWEELHSMRVDNAQGFVALDLNRYRGYISEADFRSLLKEQETIKKGDYYSNIKDDDKKIQDALKKMGLGKNARLWFLGDKKDIAFSEIKNYVREFEARKGRKITDTELNDFIGSLNYKGSDGVMLYKKYENGMRDKVGFIKDVANDFVYFQKKHNGQLPSNEEKDKIINFRLKEKSWEKKTKAQETISKYTSNANDFRNINKVTPKANEQKILTHFADSIVPQLSKDLGFNLRVTSRFRNQKGSHHAEGRALDIGLSDVSNENRLKVYEKLLALPQVKALGCSDPNILAKFGHSKDPKHYNAKIVDERDYDKKHGTNHSNHVHITLFNDFDFGTTKTALNNNGVYKF